VKEIAIRASILGTCIAFLPGFSTTGVAERLRVDELYQGRTIVTGTREETRRPGIAECYKDVIVKVSGDPRLTGDPRVAELAKQTGGFVYHYHDRMEGIPIHDEQGSRDRPYDLFVLFDPSKIDAALGTLGRKPWGQDRPRVAMFVAVHLGDTAYVLASDGALGIDQRESLEAASWQMGVPVTVPSKAALMEAGVTMDTLESIDLSRLDVAAKRAGGDLALSGDLAWEKGRAGWVANWRLLSGGVTYRWQIQDVNFDDAFRSAMRGAAQILSGNGAPR
jgi:hypothetical protein